MLLLLCNASAACKARSDDVRLTVWMGVQKLPEIPEMRIPTLAREKLKSAFGAAEPEPMQELVERLSGKPKQAQAALHAMVLVLQVSSSLLVQILSFPSI